MILCPLHLVVRSDLQNSSSKTDPDEQIKAIGKRSSKQNH